MGLFIKKDPTRSAGIQWPSAKQIFVKVDPTRSAGIQWKKVKAAFIKASSGQWRLFWPSIGPKNETDVLLTTNLTAYPATGTTYPVLTGTNYHWDGSGTLSFTYDFQSSSTPSGTWTNIKSATYTPGNPAIGASNTITYTPVFPTDYPANPTYFNFRISATDSVGTNTSDSYLNYTVSVSVPAPVWTATTPRLSGVYNAGSTAQGFWNVGIANISASSSNISYYTTAYRTNDGGTTKTYVIGTASTPDKQTTPDYKYTLSFAGMAGYTYYFTTYAAADVLTPTPSTSYSANQLIAIAPPDTPINLQRTVGNAGAKTFTWSAATTGSTLTGYEYQLNNLGWINNGLTTSVSFTGLSGTNTFQVRAYNATGASASATTGSFVIPVINSGPSASPVTYNQAQINWTSTNQANFSVSIPGAANTPYTNSGNPTALFLITPIGDIAATTTYTPTLTIYSSTNDTATTTGASFTTPAAPPNPPTNLQRTLNTGSSKTFTWSAPSSGPTPTGYEYQLNSNGWVNNGTSLSVTLNGLSGTNTFQVRAYNATGSGSPASTGSFTIVTINSTPYASPVVYNQATINWTSSGQYSYSVAIPGALNTPYTGINSNLFATTGLGDLSANTTYTPTVTLYSSSGDYVSATGTSFTTPDPKPLAPSNLTRTLGPGLTKTFSWSAPVGGTPATGYEYAINNGTYINNGTSLSVTLTLASGANTFAVRAYNANGSGPSANTGSFTIPTITTNPTANSILDTSATVSWASTGQATYSLSVPGATGTPYTGTTATSTSVTTVANTSYTPTLTVTSSSGDYQTVTGTSWTSLPPQPTISGISLYDSTVYPGSASSISVGNSATTNVGSVTWANGSNTTNAWLYSVSGSGSGGSTTNPGTLNTSGTFSIISTGIASATIAAVNTTKTTSVTWAQTNTQSYSIIYTISGFASAFTLNGNSSVSNPVVLLLSDTVSRLVTLSSITLYTGLNQTGYSKAVSNTSSVTAANTTTYSSGSGSVTYTNPSVGVLSYPSISGSGAVGTNISFSGGSYTNASTVTTQLVVSTNTSFSSSSGVKTSTSPYTVTSVDATAPAYYFATRDTVLGTNGITYYFWSGNQTGSSVTLPSGSGSILSYAASVAPNAPGTPTLTYYPANTTTLDWGYYATWADSTSGTTPISYYLRGYGSNDGYVSQLAIRGPFTTGGSAQYFTLPRSNTTWKVVAYASNSAGNSPDSGKSNSA